MSTVIGILMIAVAAAFVIAPFFAGTQAAEAAGSGTRARHDRETLEQRKREAYAVIKEAEFDYRMGKLSDADFTAIRNRYTAQALDALAALNAAPDVGSPQATVAQPPARGAFCPACGQAAPRRANFCSACGLALSNAAA